MDEHSFPRFAKLQSGPSAKLKFVRYKYNSISIELIYENTGAKQFQHLLINTM